MRRSRRHRPSGDLAPSETPGRARFLFYTNECVGLGHLRRTLNLADAVTRRDPSASALIITGASAALREERHERIDIVKLPELSRDADGAMFAARLGMDTGHMHELRAHLALAAAETFSPSVVVVDKTPLGLNDELLPTLERLHPTNAKLVLGLRDIEDSPDAVRQRWGAGLREPISRLYDMVMVYGPPSSVDALSCMEWSDLDLPVHHVGFVGSPTSSVPAADLPPDYLLVTAGGGMDGYPMFDAVLGALASRPLDIPVVMVTGPLMPIEEREDLARRAATQGVWLATFRNDMAAVVKGARAVVTMGGYNTVSDVIRAGKPTLVIPRTGPSQEQLIRAAALEAAGAATMVHPDDATPEIVRRAIDDVLARPVTDCDPHLYAGADRAAELLCSLATASSAPPKRFTRAGVLAGVTAS